MRNPLITTSLAAIAACLLVASAGAATIPVPAGDAVALVAAMTTAATNPDPTNTIDLAGGLYVLTAVDNTLDGPSGLASITGAKTLTVNGNGATIERSSAPATPQFRFFHIDGVPGSTLILNDLTLSGGDVGAFAGGAIRATGTGVTATTVLQMNGCTVMGCTTGNVGGALGLHRCTATLVDCVLSGNTAAVDGGAVFSKHFGVLTMTDCTVSGNVVTSGGTGGGIHRGSNGFGTETETYLTGCTIEGNMVLGAGGRGGGLFHECFVSTSTRILEMELCTISGNSAAGDGGGVCNFSRDICCGGFSAVAEMNITSSTITANSAGGQGGGFVNLDSGGTTSSVIRLRNSIVSGNSAGTGGDDGAHVSTTLSSLGYNLIGDNSTLTATFPAGAPNPGLDWVGTAASPLDARLDALAARGGPTMTHGLFADSPARDHGDPTQGPLDQRGQPRPLGAGVDIGSYEAIPTPTCTLASPGGVLVGDIFLTLDVTTAGSASVDVSFEFSTDSGASFAPCAPATSSPLPNPATGVALGMSDFHWDSSVDGVGVAAVATGVLVRAFVLDGVALYPGTCAAPAFDVDNTAPTCGGICGDCNLAGSGPDILDALSAAQIAAGLLAPTPDQLTCCDVNGSLAVEVLDALVMAQAAAGIPVPLACP